MGGLSERVELERIADDWEKRTKKRIPGTRSLGPEFKTTRTSDGGEG